jgi:hypothetical protein
VTIGGGDFLPGTIRGVGAAANSLDGTFGLSSDGKRLQNFGCSCITFSATVNGTLAPPPVAGVITFGTAAADTDNVRIEAIYQSGGVPNTAVNLIDSAPLRSPVPAGAIPPVLTATGEPRCTYYLVTSAAVCVHLTQGIYTLIHRRGTSTLGSALLTVPGQSAQAGQVPTLAAARVPGVAGGDQLQLVLGPRILTTLTVNPLTVNYSLAGKDLENGVFGSVTGTCTPGIYFTDREDLCPVGTITMPNNLGDSSVTLFGVSSSGQLLGQLDDTSAGSTEVDIPEVAFSVPGNRVRVNTPSTAFAIARYNDPLPLADFANSLPAVGGLVPVSLPSSAPVQLSIAPVGSTAFRGLGNANQMGGVTIASLAPGPYVARFSLFDGRGDVSTFESLFVGDASPPAGPTASRCSVRASGHTKATLAARKRRKPSSHQVTLTVSCPSRTRGTHIALFLQRGSTIVASGTGVTGRGPARIKLKGKLVSGMYLLIEVLGSGSAATESTRTLTLKVR